MGLPDAGEYAQGIRKRARSGDCAVHGASALPMRSSFACPAHVTRCRTASVSPEVRACMMHGAGLGDCSPGASRPIPRRATGSQVRLDGSGPAKPPASAVRDPYTGDVAAMLGCRYPVGARQAFPNTAETARWAASVRAAALWAVSGYQVGAKPSRVSNSSRSSVSSSSRVSANNLSLSRCSCNRLTVR